MSDLLFIDDCKHEWSECGEHCKHCLNDRDLIEAFTDIQDLLSQANAEIEEKNKLFQTSSDGGANLYKMLLEANAEIERLKGVSLPLVDCYSCCEANIAKPSLHKHHDERFELTLLVRDCPNCGAFSETLSTEIPKEQGE